MVTGTECAFAELLRKREVRPLCNFWIERPRIHANANGDARRRGCVDDGIHPLR